MDILFRWQEKEVLELVMTVEECDTFHYCNKTTKEKLFLLFRRLQFARHFAKQRIVLIALGLWLLNCCIGFIVVWL